MTLSIKMYENSDTYKCGITLKDESIDDKNNMAFYLPQYNKLVIKNRKKVANELHVCLRDFVCANQTHSVNVYEVTEKDRGRGAHCKESAIPNVDALYTYEAGIVLCTFSADCVPIIFYNKKSGIIGVIHSGWRGTVNEITRHVFEQLKQNKKCHISEFNVIIGPSISQEKFEVDEDVFKLYKGLGYADEHIRYEERTNKFHIDNKNIVQIQCEQAGIQQDRIIVDPMCTYIDQKGFSYRKNKTSYRHMAFIVKKL